MDVKERIIGATIEEFNEKGIKFTMDSLAKRLSMSKKTLYSVFANKETLLRETVSCGFGDIKAAERKILEDDTLDVVDKLRRIIIVLPDKYQASDFRKLSTLKGKYPDIYYEIASKIEGGWEPVFELFNQAIAEGKVKNVNLYVIKSIISGAMENFISTEELSEHQVEYGEALEILINVVMDGIVVKGD